MLKTYIDDYRCAHTENSSKYVFTNLLDGQQLTSSAISVALRKQWNRAGLSQPFSATLVRKSAVTWVCILVVTAINTLCFSRIHVLLRE